MVSAVSEALGSPIAMPAHKLLGANVNLIAFVLRNHDVVAVRQQGTCKVWVTLDSIEFPELVPVERLWLHGWEQFSTGAH